MHMRTHGALRSCQVSLHLFERLVKGFEEDIENQDEKVEESRNLLINLCLECKATLMNTQFQKPDNNLATHKKPDKTPNLPMTRPQYETTDYWLTTDRWKKQRHKH